jgi:predicted DNA-binding transcriptional regulator YafY
MNRFDRLNAILLMLQTRRSVTAAFLAEHFGVSERTIYRDMRSLSTAGVMVEGEAGVGYYLPKDYKIPPVMFSEPEAAALLISAEIAEKLLDKPLRESLNQASLKIRAVLPAEVNRHLEALKEKMQVHLDEPRGDVSWLIPLQKAVARRLVLSIEYKTVEKQQKREIEPVGLVFYSRQWHVIAWCRLRNDFRDFRVDRIQSLNETGEVLHGDSRMGLEAYLNDLRHQQQFEECRVSFSDDAWKRFETSPYQTGFMNVQQDDKGLLIARFLVWDLNGFCRWLLTFAGDAQPLDDQAKTVFDELVTALNNRH